MRNFETGTRATRSHRRCARLPLAAAIYRAAIRRRVRAGSPPQAGAGPRSPPTSAAPRRPTRSARWTRSPSPRRSARKTCRRCRSASRCSARRQLDQQNVTDFDDYAKLIPSLSYGTAGGGVFSGPGSCRSTCAAWPAAATATIPVRSPASACTSTSSRSPRSTARSTSTCTTSPASRRSPARRARCTAPARRPARCASSPTSPIQRLRRRLRGEVNAIDGGGIGHVLEGFVNVPLSERAAIRLVGWEKHDAGYVDNVRARARSRPRASTHRQRRPSPRTTTTTPTPSARARR